MTAGEDWWTRPKKETLLAERRTRDAISGAVTSTNVMRIMDRASIHSERERVIVYVDGFNLYFGMIEAGLSYCKWLNLTALAQSLLKPGQLLADVKYFTSKVGNNPEKQKRQRTYIEALEEQGVQIHYGHYQKNSVECNRCGHIWPGYNEKMTDVNSATQMIIDAYRDNFDMAMLISGDSDLVPPIMAIHENFPEKRVCVMFPPRRHSSAVAMVAKGSYTIGRKKLVESQFPSEVKKRDGYILRKPKDWK